MQNGCKKREFHGTILDLPHITFYGLILIYDEHTANSCVCLAAVLNDSYISTELSCLELVLYGTEVMLLHNVDCRTWLKWLPAEPTMGLFWGLACLFTQNIALKESQKHNNPGKFTFLIIAAIAFAWAMCGCSFVFPLPGKFVFLVLSQSPCIKHFFHNKTMHAQIVFKEFLAKPLICC